MEEALERDGRGEEATVEDRERSAYGRGEEWRKRDGGQAADSEKREREEMEAGGESDEAVGAVVQHVTVPSASEMRDEATGAVAQRATAPRECESASEIEQRFFESSQWRSSFH